MFQCERVRLTQWKIENEKSFFKIAQLEDYPDRRFFRQWEIKLTFPMIVLTLCSISILLYLTAVLPFINSRLTRKICFFEMIFTFIMFLWSYLAAVLMDPGFLPFNWFETQKSWYCWEEQLSGIAINDEQLEYVNNHPRPVDASFSTKFGRFILRGDHICGWIANWVGKRNHKQFILLMFWGSIFTLSLGLPRIFDGPSLHDFSEFLESLENIVFGIEIFVSVFLFSMGVSQIIEASYNRTKIRMYKGMETENTKKMDGLKEIFGYGNILLWVIPTPAFEKGIPLKIQQMQQIYTV